MSIALALHDVHKRFGTNRALQGLSFTLPKGVICGLIGANGAGKTTLFSILAGFTPYDKGSISILGKGPFSIESHKGRLGILPQDSALPTEISIESMLYYYAQFQGLSKQMAQSETARLLKAVNLWDRRSHRIKQLSHGMRRRVAVAQAMLGNPELILLDEPTAGLDPAQTMEMLKLFRHKRQNSTLVISSHILSELEAVCDYVVFMEQGTCKQSGPIEQVTNQNASIRIELKEKPDITVLQQAFPHVDFQWQSNHLLCTSPAKTNYPPLSNQILHALLQQNVEILSLHRGHGLAQHFTAPQSS